MKLNNYARFFEELVNKGANPTIAATLLLQTLTELKRNNINIKNISQNEIKEVLLLEKKGKINKNKIKEILVQIASGKTIKEILDSQVQVDDSLVEKEIIKVINNNLELVKSKGLGSIGPLMGDLKQVAALKEADKKLVSEILRKEISKVK